jgi:hypothetical protein
VTRRTASGRLAGGRRIAVAVVLLATVGLAGSCTDPHDEFCDRLRSTYRMTTLADAIDRDDTATISEQLQVLKDLADDAPRAIAIDLHVIVDAITETVRAVTNVTSPGGERMTVDIEELNRTLANVSQNSQRVAEWADRDCNLVLSR